jgi:hypothetical protein
MSAPKALPKPIDGMHNQDQGGKWRCRKMRTALRKNYGQPQRYLQRIGMSEIQDKGKS